MKCNKCNQNTLIIVPNYAYGTEFICTNKECNYRGN